MRVNKNIIYHRIGGIEAANEVVETGVLKAGKLGCISTTRNKNYLSKSRPYYVAFDYDELRRYYKIKPCCHNGLGILYHNDGSRVVSDITLKMYKQSLRKESEERIYVSELPISLAIDSNLPY